MVEWIESLSFFEWIFLLTAAALWAYCADYVPDCGGDDERND